MFEVREEDVHVEGISAEESARLFGVAEVGETPSSSLDAAMDAEDPRFR